MIEFVGLNRHLREGCQALQHTHCNVLQNPAKFCYRHRRVRNCRRSLRTHNATLCSTLQHAAAHCSTLQHAAAHCSTLQHAAAHCSTHRSACSGCRSLRTHATTHSNTWQCTATYTLQHTHCNTNRNAWGCRHCLRAHTTARYNTLQHTATRCNTYRSK